MRVPVDRISQVRFNGLAEGRLRELTGVATPKVRSGEPLHGSGGVYSSKCE